MGKGSAQLADAAPFQVPRLTSVLRALTSDSSEHIDVDAQHIARQQLLEKKRAVLNLPKSGGVGRSALAQRLFGPWEKAPKAAKDIYEQYLKATASVIDGELSSSELHDAASLAWDVLSPLPPPQPVRGRPDQLVLTPYRDALTAAFGPINAGSLQQLVLLAQQLKACQARLQPGGGSSSSGSAGSAASAAAGAAAAAGGSSSAGAGELMDREFGDDIQFNAVSTSDDGLGWLQDGPAGGRGPRAGGGLEPSPAELRQMVRGAASSAAQGGARSGNAAGAAAGGLSQAGTFSLLPDLDADEDLGEEYEEGKRVKEVNLHWLQRWCSNVAGPDQASTVADAVCHILLLDRSSDEAAMQLLELLGDHTFEAITDLIEKRKLLIAPLKLALGKLKAELGDGADAPGMPSYGSQVTITSESAKLLAKLQRKEQRKGAKGGPGRGADTEELELLQQVGFEALLDTERDYSATLVLADGLEFKIGGDGALGAGRKALPKGTVRKSYKGYEEVSVPAPPRAPPPTENELVKIADLEDWAQLAFEGYKTLNRIQSRIFKTAYYSNENMLVCAPTGAGKTNIAMITVLREIGANMRYGVIQKGEFKIVYIAPMKALAAEVTANFAKRLAPLGLIVRELTGDMQLSKKELAETQMIVTTPEKWDVITRKGGDVSIASLVKLLIFDEVHLLNDDRGPVIETLVARTQRQVEASQNMIRIVGLSATLPNYEDVATFLHVNISSGLFHFDASFRPVPLELSFVGVTQNNFVVRQNLMAEICYNKVVDSLKRGHQVMVFVHSRKDTGKTARQLSDLAVRNGDVALFDCREHDRFGIAQKDVRKSRNREVVELFDLGFGIHHAGMLRSDRTTTERLFADGLIKVLVCTATLAWGVNLPAHTVVIKGTQVYDAQKGTFTDVGMLDVQQIFGRAGRPQFDTSGEAIIITTHSKLAHYLGMLTSQVPIESQFKSMLVDNLNAEIVLGTVTNIREAAQWLSYTYLYTRMTKNPLVYGLTYQDLASDPTLESHKRSLVVNAAQQLKASQMAVFDEKSGNLYVTELGRVASHFYIRHNTMVTFNSTLKQHMAEADILAMMAQSSEFESMMVREEELPELEKLLRECCPYDVKGGVENKHGKVNILMQAYISRVRLESFSLTADMMYVSSNAPRIIRAVFEICIRRKWSSMADTCMTLCKCFEKQLWPTQHPLRQFESVLSPELLHKLEDRGLWLDTLQDMSAAEIGAAVRHPAAGTTIKGCVDSFPTLHMEAQLQPITRTVLRVQLTIRATFDWKDRAHGAVLRWLILVEDSANEHVYHSEVWLLTKKMAREGDQKLAFTIPIFEPLPSQYYVRAVSDDWLGAETLLPISFQSLILPERMPPHTELLDLDPLPLSALNNPTYEAMYTGRFTHFNPIQTQAFHTLYHTDENVLLGAPTGSGKTISSELTMLRVFSHHPDRKIIYIAPLKALVRERIEDWTRGLCARLNKKMVELTGDYTPDLRALLAADVIICTPEKWDGISRNWQARSYVKKVGLVIIDEIHLLGADRGPILEVIVSRMRYISSQTNCPVRFVGLSTALANAQDLADWLGIGPAGLFNFKPSVRPVPLECHIQGYPGKFYCPRMATMNKPAYAAIQVHSPTKPVLVFVSSRRQTRLTALDLITYAVGDMRPQQWVHMSDEELEEVVAGVKDASLRHTLQFGIGLHHAGLNDRDRSLVERLYVECKIQVLVATSTLAWGVNTPAHLVIIKGTEFYDAPTRRYVDFPITDVLQMMGRAGRPQFDQRGVAVIMVHEPKKQFYKRFLYEPFPVESSLHGQVPDHFNAEIVGGTISSKQDAVDYLTWTFFFRRLVQNPSYYDLTDTTSEALNVYLSELVESALGSLEEGGCITIGADGDDDSVQSTTMGRIASFYYLQHTTMTVFTQQLHGDMELREVLQTLCAVPEYDELPVRHNEDKLNTAMAREARFPVDTRTADDPHTKANLLLQAHMSRQALPITDYITDTKGVLDNSLRILQAMVDVCADAGWLVTTLSVVNLIQSLMQARWADDNALLILPHITPAALGPLQALGITCLPQLVEAVTTAGNRPTDSTANHPQRGAVVDALGGLLGGSKAQEVVQVCERLPVIGVRVPQPQLVRSRRGGESSSSGLDHDLGLNDEAPEASAGGEEFEEWMVDVELQRLRRGRQGAAGTGAKGRPRVYAPRFPKVKEEGWYVVAGDTSTRELLALKRVSLEERAGVKLRLPRYNGAGAELAAVTVYLMSDSYLGLDQQYEVVLVPGRAAQSRRAAGAAGSSGAGAGAGEEQPASTAGSAGAERRARRAAARQQRAEAPTEDAASGSSGTWGGLRDAQLAQAAADGEMFWDAGDGLQQAQQDGDTLWEDEPGCA